MAVKKYNKLTGGLNLTQSSQIDDADLSVAKNVFYNNAKQLQTRRGYKKFGSQIGSKPITSYFFFQRDDNQEKIAVCHSGNDIYSLDSSTLNWSSIASNKREFETLPGKTGNRVRWDYAVYKKIVYMTNGVDNYAKYDGTSYSDIGVSAAATVTFDSSTDYVNKSGHTHVVGDELYFYSSGDMPGGVVAYQVYYVVEISGHNYKISSTKGGDALDITSNGTGTISERALTEPRTRYIHYMQDRLFFAGDDANPNTLYYTDSAPTNGDDVNANAVVIGGDENGIINGIEEYFQLPAVFKSQKVYTVNLAATSVQPVDTQTGGYSDRTIHPVNNNLMYFNERGVDGLKKVFGVSGTGGIGSEPFSIKVREAIKDVTERQYNAQAAWYSKALNNYYLAFDANDDNIPESTLVYNSMVNAWTQYILPPIYDFGEYIDDNGVLKYLFASASGGQMYEFETGFTDNGLAIECQARTKPFDFDDPAQVKAFDFINVTGYKALGNSIDITVLVDGESVAVGQVTDAHINRDESKSLGVSAIGTDTIGSSASDEGGLSLYPFTVRLPFFSHGTTIAIDLSSSGVQRIWEKFRISVEGQTFDYFTYGNTI